MTKIFIGGEYQYDYKIHVDDKNEVHYQLYFSNDELWNEINRGKLAYEIVDDGFKIKTKIQKDLEYDEAEGYMILLQIRYNYPDSYCEILLYDNPKKLA